MLFEYSDSIFYSNKQNIFHIWLSIGTIFTQYIMICNSVVCYRYYSFTHSKEEKNFKKKKNYNLGSLELVIIQKKRLIKCIE